MEKLSLVIDKATILKLPCCIAVYNSTTARSLKKSLACTIARRAVKVLMMNCRNTAMGKFIWVLGIHFGGSLCIKKNKINESKSKFGCVFKKFCENHKKVD